MKVIMIDDSPIVLFELQTILEELGFEILATASDGENGFRLIQSLQPDIVTLDIVMPGLDGVELLKRIISLNRQTKIIMISALGKHQTILECLKLGADNFIEKPFVKSQIIEVFKKYLA